MYNPLFVFNVQNQYQSTVNLLKFMKIDISGIKINSQTLVHG